MELYEEMLHHFLGQIQVSFQVDAARIVADASYRALAQIKAILEDGGASDAQCFARIEEIVRVYEGIGSGAGARHDFG